MVTKVTELRHATEFASNFEYDPASTSGLSFGLSPGSAKKIDDTLYEFPGGTVLLTANTTGTLYLDTATATPAFGFEATITSGSYIPLYRISTTGSAITSIEDVRSWTSASIGPDLVAAEPGANPVDVLTPFETLVSGYSPLIWYRFNEDYNTSDILLNNGSVGSTFDLYPPTERPTSDQYDIPFPRVRSGDVGTSYGAFIGGRYPISGHFYLGWDKRSISTTDLEWLTDTTTGSFIFVCAWGYDANSQNSAIFELYNTSSGSFGVFNIGLTGDFLQIKWDSSTSSLEDWEIRTVAGINQDPDFPIYKVIVVSQPADGNGPKLYVDGADLTNYFTMPVGSEDKWFNDWTTGGSYANTMIMGGEWSATFGTTNNHEGILDQFAYTSTALTQAQALALYNAYNGL